MMSLPSRLLAILILSLLFNVLKVNTSVRAGHVSRKNNIVSSTPREKIAYVKLDKPWAPGRDV